MPNRTIYLPDDLDRGVNAEVEAGDDEVNRSTVIQNALREYDGVDA